MPTQSLVKDLTVPISKFPKISDSATFSGAVFTLEKAEEEFNAGKREQRIVVVVDKHNNVVGKLSPLDVVRGLEPNYDKIVDSQHSAHVGNFDYVIQSMKDQTLLWSSPLDDLCATAKDVLVRDFITAPRSSQVIDHEETLDKALHRFVVFRHDSLFVMSGDKLIGLLRFSDVYREISRRLRDTCRL
jgi:hypothetical protein